MTKLSNQLTITILTLYYVNDCSISDIVKYYDNLISIEEVYEVLKISCDEVKFENVLNEFIELV